ncbi:MAG: hypothetical protein AAF443_01910 [Chlamydiota bacterium]
MKLQRLYDIEVREVCVTFSSEAVTRGIASIEIKGWAILRGIPWKIIGKKLVVWLPGLRDKEKNGFCHFVSFGDKHIEKLIKKRVEVAVREKLSAVLEKAGNHEAIPLNGVSAPSIF